MPEDYGKWVLSIKEVLVLLLLVLTGGTAAGWLFFGNVTVGAAAGVLCLVFLPKYKNWRIEKRRRELLIQFRDLLYSVASSVSVGRSMTQALEESLNFWNGMYDENDLIIMEVKAMLQRIKNSNEKDVDVLKDFAQRSGLPDVADFVSVYECCKSSGANLVQAINRAAAIIGDRIALERELHTMMAQKQFESRIVMAAPFLLLLFLKILSPEYLLPLTASEEGRAISLMALGLTGAACLMMERVNQVEI